MAVLQGPITPTRADQSTAPGGGPGDLAAARRGGVEVWAVAGLIWLVLAGQAYGRWMLSATEFRPAPILGPDVYPLWREVLLRVLECASLVVAAAFIWFCVIRPLRRDGRLSLDGRLVIGGLVASVADACLNLYGYMFAWNAHSVNRGVWIAFMPFHRASSSSHYAESLIWGTCMYIYFFAGAGLLGTTLISALRTRRPRITNTAAYTLVFCGDFVLGLLLENLIIRTTQAYGYAHTYAPLTLFAGSQYQYPIYESIFSACVGVVFTYVRMSALEAPDGVSCIERGYHRWPARWHGLIRTIAVIGFSAAVALAVYHLPVNWLNVDGNSIAHLPSYMLPG